MLCAYVTSIEFLYLLRCFDSVDIDGSGKVEWSEYVFSLMGEDAMMFSPMADLELLDQLIGDADKLLANLNSSMKESEESNKVRAERNAELRNRLGEMKKKMNGSLGKVMSKMLGILGQDARDLLTDAQIAKLLNGTFDKFDRDNSGILEIEEFHKAWAFLGLSGTPTEIDRAFKAVDVDSSGKVDRDEFAQAVKDSRLAELSLTVLVEGMDGHLEGLEEIFVSYKSKLEEARKAAAEGLENNRNKFMQYQT